MKKIIVVAILFVFCFASSAFAISSPEVSFSSYGAVDGFHLLFSGYGEFKILKVEVVVNNKLVGTIVPQRVMQSRQILAGVGLLDSVDNFQGDVLINKKGSYIVGIKTYYSKRGYFYSEIRRVVDDMAFELSWAYTDCNDPNTVVVEHYGMPMLGFTPTNGEIGMIQLGNYDYPAQLNCYGDGEAITYCYTQISVDKAYYDKLIKNQRIDTFFRFDSFVSHTEVDYFTSAEYCPAE